MEAVHSSVVSLRSLRLITFLAAHNELELWVADIGNAYLESYTKEKLYIVAGPEFGPELEGDIFIMKKALYGTRSGGKCWHQRFSDVLREEQFEPCKGCTDVWMRKASCGTHYEYIAVYVDDLLMAMKDPKVFCDTLKQKYNFKLKGDGPIDYHIGLNYSQDEDGTLKTQPKKYIEKMNDYYKRTFDDLPKKFTSPLEKGDHPEVDETPLLGEEGTRTYLSMVGQLQWLVSLGRFDIFSAVVTMSRFRSMPREGHLDRLKRMFGYVRDTEHASIRVRTDLPDYSNLPDQEFNWAYSVYRDVHAPSEWRRLRSRRRAAACEARMRWRRRAQL